MFLHTVTMELPFVKAFSFGIIVVAAAMLKVLLLFNFRNTCKSA